ncbi:helix-turn-helix domain-containing protein, partial [Candidatus Magnetaquicoccus inordinatus]|uniref:helix-turn-helix domain-containing protein n=1 Tax=Candidatus Magnetaquicoccus inordinatus TaxID=2496818 RepID=UPI00102AA080
DFSERLREERKRLGHTQDEMAEIGGIAKSSLCNYEAGKREPTASFFTAIADAGVDVMYVLTGTRSGVCDLEQIAQEVVGTMFVVETILEKEGEEVTSKYKADIVYSAYLQSTPEERRAMLRALDEGVFTIPYSVAKLFGLSAK